VTSANLWDICNSVYFPRRLKIRSPLTREHYRYALNDFGRFLGRPAELVDLNDDCVTLWLGDMLTKGDSLDEPRSVETALSRVGRVLTLWRFLACRRMVDAFPTVELPQAPEPEPIALDESQLTRLFESAHCRPGMICGVPARYWWPALFGFVFCTSERKGATLATRWDWVDLDRGVVSIPANVRKGKRKPAVYHLWDEVTWLLRRIHEPRRELVFPWEKTAGAYYKRYGTILEDAQIPNDRKHKTQSLRVTHNTWTKVMTGHHSPLMSHSSESTSERFYEDKRFTAAPPPKLFVPWRVPQPDPPRAA